MGPDVAVINFGMQGYTMKRSKIEEMFRLAKSEVVKYSTKQYVLIVESNNQLVIGLLTPKEEVCVDGGGYVGINEHLVTWAPEKPFTMKQLVKISKIWRELLQSE